MIKGFMCLALAMVGSFICAYLLHIQAHAAWWNTWAYLWVVLATSVSVGFSIYFFGGMLNANPSK